MKKSEADVKEYQHHIELLKMELEKKENQLIQEKQRKLKEK
jgi:hypothetical protein